ncbi:SYNE1 [Mytilus edulis]|uniref:SYNE1 n=1 Tax=Mytilus edulis TaxID=6550 RepID=A0A8S3QGY8_MYTED|nr:SYNE1 [Mytilus edulis]
MVNEMLQTLNVQKEVIVRLRKEIPERIKYLKAVLPNVESLETGILDLNAWLVKGEALLATHKLDGDHRAVEERLEKHKQFFSETTYQKSIVESKNKVHQKVTSTKPKLKNVNFDDVDIPMEETNTRFQSLISAAKDWEKKLDNLSRLWKVYSQKEQALAGWLQQAQTVLNDNEDDSDSLIRKHKGFFNKIDKRLLDDYLRAGQDILMVLDDRDKSELQQDMASMQETWKNVQASAPIKLVKLEFRLPEEIFIEQVDDAEKHFNKNKNNYREMKMLNRHYRNTDWPVVIVTVGPLIEETEVWKSMEPTIRTINTFMESSVKQMEQLNDASSSMSKMNEMLKYAMQYSPELVQGVFDMMKNQICKDMADFCQKQILLSMPMPSYVPVSEINDMMCTTNWTEVIIEMTAMYDMTGAIEKVDDVCNDGQQYTESSPFDWTGMVKNVDKMVTIYSSPSPLMEGNPIVTIMSMNMSILQETMNVVMNNLQEMNVQNITALTSLSLSMMEQLDTTMSSNNMWKTMKFYLDFWNSYVLLVNKQLENQQLIVDINFLANMSSTFAEFIQTSSAAIPGLLEALKNTTVDVTQV